MNSISRQMMMSQINENGCLIGNLSTTIPAFIETYFTDSASNCSFSDNYENTFKMENLCAENVGDDETNDDYDE